MLDDVSQAVLAREEVVKYLQGGYGEKSEAEARERVNSYLEELRTTQRYHMYRALQHPLYPILRKIEKVPEHAGNALDATARHRVVSHRITRATSTISSSPSCSTTPVCARRSLPRASTCSVDRS